MRKVVGAAFSAGTGDPDEEMLATFGRIFFGAVSSAGESVSTSDEPSRRAPAWRSAIGFLLTGLRELVESGRALPRRS